MGRPSSGSNTSALSSTRGGKTRRTPQQSSTTRVREIAAAHGRWWRLLLEKRQSFQGGYDRFPATHRTLSGVSPSVSEQVIWFRQKMRTERR
jgi:hypothetical protein